MRMGSGGQRELDPAESVLRRHCAMFRQQGTKMASSWAVYVTETHSRPQNVRIMQTWMTQGYKTACKYTLLERRGVMCSVGDWLTAFSGVKSKSNSLFCCRPHCLRSESALAWIQNKLRGLLPPLCVHSAGHVCEACPLIVSSNTVAEDVRHRWALSPWPGTAPPSHLV